MGFHSLASKRFARWPDPIEDKRMEAAVAAERANKVLPSRIERILTSGATTALLTLGADVLVQSSDTANRTTVVMEETQDDES